MELAQTQEEPVYEMFDYAKAKVRIDRLIGTWSEIKTQAEKHRTARYVPLDVEVMRQNGDIERDETFIPQRIIDNNITREKADAMAFLNAANRLAYFRCVTEPTLDTRQLEQEFTKGLTYSGWYKQFQRHYDGAALHGWDSVEVVFDTTKELHVAFEHVGHNRLIFNRQVEHLQDSEIVLREYKVSTLKLKEFVSDFAFDAAQVDQILQKTQFAQKDDEVICIYKGYFKFNKCVYVFWYSAEGYCQAWLKAPEKFRCGIRKQVVVPAPIQDSNIGVGMTNVIQQGGAAPMLLWQDIDVDTYPVFLLIYKDDEQQAITDHVGRGFTDLPMQEAVTAITTAFVNSTIRASNVFGSPETDDGESADIKQLDTPVENGVIFNRPMRFFHMPWPDPMALNALQYLDSNNAAQMGKIGTAVSNRKDSRKTAKELTLANREETKITSTNLADYAEFLREVFFFSWRIVQSQALEGEIIFLRKPIVETDPLGMQTTVMGNDTETIQQQFDVRSSGEVDVLQKEKLLNDMRTDWPVIQATPLAQKFMEDYVRLEYPMRAEEYVAILKSGDPKLLVAGLLEVLNASMQPEELASLPPDKQAQLQQLVQQAQAYVGTPTGPAEPAQAEVAQ